ncbi:MAG: rod shape-determining protein MreC [Defluviitaleaceae bacterium]|nr:rod shape-determining protein MreC [Defluviitaleaceae bacterium]
MSLDVLTRHKKAFLLSGIGICLVAIVLTISQGTGTNIVTRGLSVVVTPVQQGLSATIAWVQGHFTALANNQGLIAQNRDLTEEITLLQLENHRLQQAAEENERLNAVLNMHQRYAALPTIGARVIAHDPNDWNRGFTIDVGSRDGITPGMAVFGGGGLAGVVRYVNPTSSQVVSIIDSRFAAAVIGVRTEDVGTVRGDVRLMQQGLLRMEHFDITAQILPGDEIETSAHGTMFPRGIRVGTVQEIHTNPDGLTRHAVIEPSANLNNIEIVLVVTELFNE